MDSDELCDSLVIWLHTFEIDNEQYTAEALTDGVTMTLVLHQIAPEYFDKIWMDKIKKDATNNWRLKVSNLKKILKGMLEYYSEVLCLHITDFQMPDVNQIGEHNNRKELGRLLQLILGCAVNCEDKQEYIKRIMSLEEEVQHVVMSALQELMSKETPASSGEGNAELESQLKRTIEELNSVIETRDELTHRCHELDLQVTALQDDKMALTVENEKLADRLNQADSLDDPSTMAGKRFQQLQREVEQLQDENFRLEGGTEDSRIKVELLERELLELQQKNEELTQLADESRTLSDELDVLRESSNKVAKYETTIDMYKKKLEEMTDLKRQVKMLEEKNTNYMQSSMELEEELKKSNAIKTQLDMYKRQVQELQLKSSEETKRADKADFEAKRVQDKLSSLLREKERLTSERDTLKEANEELNFSQIKQESLQGEASFHGADDLSLEMMNLPPDIKEKFIRLQLENKKLKLTHGEEEDSQLLKAMLEDSQSRNNELESENRIINQKVMELQAQLEDIQENTTNIPQPQETSNLELRKKLNDQLHTIRDLETELQKRTTSLEETDTRMSDISEENKKLKESVNKKEEEMRAMEERYKKYLDKAKSVIKSLDSKSNPSSSPSAEVSVLKSQLQEKERFIEHLEKDHEKAKNVREQEEKLMVTAWYDLGMQLHRKAAEERLSKSGQHGHSFLARQRQAHSRRAQSLASPPNVANSDLFVDFHPSHFSLTPSQEATQTNRVPAPVATQ